MTLTCRVYVMALHQALQPGTTRMQAVRGSNLERRAKADALELMLLCCTIAGE